MSIVHQVPGSRIQSCNVHQVRIEGDYVLYWMIAFRRTAWNFALDRAIEWASDLRKPLLVFEPLRIGYRWASDRLHRFVIDGMAENAAQLARLNNRGVKYFPYVEPTANAGKGLLAALAERACVVVTDDFPAFFLPQMVSAVAARLPVKLERVDSNGLLPLRAADRTFTTAYSFRRFLQKHLRDHLEQAPRPDPLANLHLPRFGSLPAEVVRRWAAPSDQLLAGSDSTQLARLAIDHSVAAVRLRGGPVTARRRLRRFLDTDLAQYSKNANEPDASARSGLSPYFHFGHISAHQVFHELMRRQDWSVKRLATRPNGRRHGWWHAGRAAEAWLDEFITWRELGYNMCARAEDYDQYESLPKWARATLEKHARDRREFLYTFDQFAAAQTHDSLWNAAQTQLLCEGAIHNYLRMLWGKKILEWTRSPREALEFMIELNNRFALDGRDPNSYSGIFWVLGRYDRPWGPERPVFGTVRYMSSDNTRRKFRVQQYLKKFGTL